MTERVYLFKGFERFWHWSQAALIIFMLVTGEWRQYIPTTDKVVAIMNFYSSGLFKNEPHPFKPTSLQKHNPLQRA